MGGCPDGYEPWSQSDCGCGCTPTAGTYSSARSSTDCPPADDASFISSDDKICSLLTISCKYSEELWIQKGCGCGCVPKADDSADNNTGEASADYTAQSEYALAEPTTDIEVIDDREVDDDEIDCIPEGGYVLGHDAFFCMM